ncbi:MAG: sensor histidine kinase [Clostridia bacterium]|nr:sensor histidine kinase [Clostridia bacterium]
MKKMPRGVLLQAVLLALSLLVLLVRSWNSSQPVRPPVKPQSFIGEYSRDGANWQALAELPEDLGEWDMLYLRGNFGRTINADREVYFYLDHLWITLEVDGQEWLDTVPQTHADARDRCGKRWQAWKSPGVGEDSLISIRLQQAHRFGNNGAFEAFLESIYVGDSIIVEDMLLQQGQMARVTGYVVGILAVALLSGAVVFRMMHVPTGSSLWAISISALSMCGYIVLDTPDVSLWNDLIVFNTYGKLLSMMNAGLGLLSFASIGMKTAARRLSSWVMTALGLFDVMLLLPCLCGVVLICHVEPLWLTVQSVAGVLILVCCFCEHLNHRPKREQWLQVFGQFELMIVLTDSVLWLHGWQYGGWGAKIGFIVLYVTYLLWVLWELPEKYRQAMRATEMERELQESRMQMMLSQIKPHFLYNSLTAVMDLCDRDPRKAKQAIVDFSRYLRANLDSLTCRKLVPFERELRHTQVYLRLEQLRFGDRLKVCYDIQAEHFLLPALSLQPLVENAVKHGLTAKAEGGTITIAVRAEAEGICITVTDDGIGFDAGAQAAEERTHVGLQNVRERLSAICGGTLTINSTPGSGTAAQVYIPKEIKNEDYGDR